VIKTEAVYDDEIVGMSTRCSSGCELGGIATYYSINA